MTGLEIKQLEQIALGEEGYLFEALRADDEMFEGQFGQNLVSFVKPGIRKGLHLHWDQTEYTTCLAGNILYVAVREVPGQNELEIEKHIIGILDRKLIKTPPGIWHGYVPLWGDTAIVLYTMDKPYDANRPDTEEIDPDHFGEDLWNSEEGVAFPFD
ncbi:hypothetical protein CMI45_00685 [Candidatus Pacearchaeota archaeon]|jgi:dTDP-4-dehydrorhamnose 3,5-epimerase-like enzyme|nr:hypothetical protein [Candidatus Pacearchaeota archaeon]|tara:strand:+ start:10383 stop:10853 length:471 start_codon:yes stop_codon:yes gene_type:complete